MAARTHTIMTAAEDLDADQLRNALGSTLRHLDQIRSGFNGKTATDQQRGRQDVALRVPNYLHTAILNQHDRRNNEVAAADETRHDTNQPRTTGKLRALLNRIR